MLQVIRQLRERNEPIRLFGESDYDACDRLKKLMMSMPEINKVRSTACRDKNCPQEMSGYMTLPGFENTSIYPVYRYTAYIYIPC